MQIGLGQNLVTTRGWAQLPIPVYGLNSRRFVASNPDYVTLANEGNFDFAATDPFSVSLWFRIATDGGIMVSKMTPVIGGVGWEIFGNPAGLSFLEKNTNSNIDQVIVATDYTDNAWHHLVAISDGSAVPANLALWVDGADASATVFADTLDGNSILNDTAVKLGTNGVSVFNGLLADLRIHNVALNPSEVATLFGEGSVKRGRVAWLPLGADLLDYSGNLNHGTATGTTPSTDGPFD